MTGVLENDPVCWSEISQWVEAARVGNVMEHNRLGVMGHYYAMDYQEDVVLMGHDGPGHIAIAEGKTRVRPLRVYHGKVGRGLSVEDVGKARPRDAVVSEILI